MKKLLLTTFVISSCSTLPIKKEEVKVVTKDGIAKLKADGSPENAIPTPTATPIPLPTVIVETVKLPIDEKIVANTQKPRPTFSTNYPYNEDKKSGIILVIFKDEYQVRYFSAKSGFVSKTGENLKFLNDLIVNKKIEFYSGTDMSNPKDEMGNYVTEEALEKKALEDKINSEKVTGDGYYSPNKLSFYKVVFKDITLKEILEPLRKEKYVLSANFDSDISNTSNSSNTTNNNSTPIPTSSGYACSGSCGWNPSGL